MRIHKGESNLVKVRQAKLDEVESLTNLSTRSEAYWGFDDEYMDRFKVLYKITKECINDNLTYVMHDEDKIIGFYSIMQKGKKASLEYFFIEPEFIGKGYGKLLWNHMITIGTRLCIKQIEIVTSPEAKEFYIKMGAIEGGIVESIVKKGRIIPKLLYNFEL